MHCRKCLSEIVVRKWRVRGKQRYRCKSCRYNFVEIDGRIRANDALKRALAVNVEGNV